MITVYSLFWSIINCCLMAFVIFLLRTRTMLISKYGTAVLRFLILCCIIRILLPVEFPEHQYILADNFLYSWIVKHFKIVLHPDFKSLLLTFLIIVWICGSLFSGCRLLLKSRKVQKIIRDNACVEFTRAKEILETIEPDCPLPVRLCSGISVPVLAGYLHPAIYFPEYPYTDEELRYVLFHEHAHWKRKDIWKKLIMNIICILVWWNPAVYIIRRELSQLLEFRCDKTLAKDLDDFEIVGYLNLLMISYERAKNPLIKTNLYTIEFVNTGKQYTIMQRFDLLLDRHTVTSHRLLPQMVIVLLALLWMFCSYYFIWQTKYATPEEAMWTLNISDYTIGDVSVVDISDENNTYLAEQEDGSYIFYYNGFTMDVPEKDVDAGLYDYYPIVEYEDDKNIFLNIFTKIKEVIDNFF